jgi:hypothetical protein
VLGPVAGRNAELERLDAQLDGLRARAGEERDRVQTSTLMQRWGCCALVESCPRQTCSRKHSRLVSNL